MVAVIQQEGSAINALTGIRVHLVQQDIGGFAVGQRQRCGLTVLYLHLLGRGIQLISGDGFQLGHGVPAAVKLRKLDDTIAVGGVGADDFPVHLADFKLNAGKPLAAALITLGNDKPADGRVGKGQGLGIIRVDHYGLGAGIFINGIAGNGLDFCDHNRAGDFIQNDLAVLIGHIQSVGGQFTALGIHKPAIGVGDLELNALQRLSGYGVNLVDNKATQLLVFDGDGLCIAAAADDNIGHSFFDGISIGRFDFCQHISTGQQIGQLDLAVGVGGEDAVLRCGCRADHAIQPDFTASRRGNAELSTRQRFAGGGIHLGDDQCALGLVLEGQAHCLSGQDADGLGLGVDGEAAGRTGFRHNNAFAGFQAVDEDFTVFIRAVDAVAGADHAAIGVSYLEFRILEGHAGVNRAYLPDQQTALGGVAEVELHHILLLAADVGGLRGGVDDMAAVAGKLLHNVGAFPQSGDGEAAICRSLIGADDCAARARGAGEVFHLKDGVRHRFSGDGIILPHHQRRQRDIFKGQGFAGAGLNIDLLGGFFDGIARGRLQLRYFVPAIPQARDLELAVFIGVEGAEVVDLAANRVVAGISDLELGSLQRITGHAVHLFDGQAGLLVILKINRVVAVGIERCKLAGSVQQIGGRYGLLRDLIHTGQQVLQLRLALAVCLDLVNAMAVCRPDFKHGVSDGFAGVSIMLIHDEVGTLLVLHGQGAGLAGEQLHVVLPHIQNVRGVRCCFLDGIHTGFQVGNQDLTLFIGCAVEVMGSILDLGDTEGDIFQPGAVRAGFDDLERGLDGVGEYELRVLVGVKLDNALRLVDDVALTDFLRDHIRAGGQLAQVDLAVFIGGKFLGAVAAVHGLDLKDGVGNDTAGVGGIHLDQPQSRLHIVEKQQLFDAVPCGQLYLLRGGVQDVTIAAGIHLHGAVGSGGDIRQQNLAKLIRAELALGNTVTPDFKGDIGHGHHVLAVVLDDPQSGQLLIYQSKGRGFAGGYRGGIGGIILQPAGGGGDFSDLIGTGLNVVKDGIAREVGFGGIDCAAFNVLDLYHGSGQVRAGVGQLFDAKGAVRLIPEGDLRHFAVLHLDVLCGGIAEQVIQWGDTLIDGVVARKGQRNGNGAVRARAEGADGGSVRADHFKNRAAQRGVRTCLQLGDFQAGVR